MRSDLLISGLQLVLGDQTAISGCAGTLT